MFAAPLAAAASLTLATLLAFACARARPALAGPTDQNRPLAPSANAVKALCVPRGSDMHVAGWAYVDGWLLCTSTDENAEGVLLYRERSPGSHRFRLVRGAGGTFTAEDLVRYGVPRRTARTLSIRLEASESASRVH